MKFLWKVMIEIPHDKQDSFKGNTTIMYGTGANVNVTIAKAKKKLKSDLNIKSEKKDLDVISVERLHAIEF